MGNTKHEGYSTELLEKAGRFKALGHPARIRIIEYLMEASSCIQEDLISVLALSRTSVHKHVCSLRNAGFFEETSYVNMSILRLNQDTLNKAVQEMEELSIGLQELE